MKHDKRSLAKRLADIRIEYQGKDWQKDDFTEEVEDLLKKYIELEYISFVMDELEGFQKIDKICYKLYKKHFAHRIETDIDVQDFYNKYKVRFNYI